jgi:hypothetical protein
MARPSPLRPIAGDDGDSQQEAGKNFANHANLQKEKETERDRGGFSHAPERRSVEETFLLRRPNDSAA